MQGNWKREARFVFMAVRDSHLQGFSLSGFSAMPK